VAEANASIGRQFRVVTRETACSLRFCFFGNKRRDEERVGWGFHGLLSTFGRDHRTILGGGGFDHWTTFGARRKTTLEGRSVRGFAGAGSRA